MARNTLIFAFMVMVICHLAAASNSYEPEFRPHATLQSVDIERLGCSNRGVLFTKTSEEAGTRFHLVTSNGQYRQWIAPNVHVTTFATHRPIAWGITQERNNQVLTFYRLLARQAERLPLLIHTQHPIPGGHRIVGQRVEPNKLGRTQQWVITHREGRLIEWKGSHEIVAVSPTASHVYFWANEKKNALKSFRLVDSKKTTIDLPQGASVDSYFPSSKPGDSAKNLFVLEHHSPKFPSQENNNQLHVSIVDTKESFTVRKATFLDNKMAPIQNAYPKTVGSCGSHSEVALVLVRSHSANISLIYKIHFEQLLLDPDTTGEKDHTPQYIERATILPTEDAWKAAILLRRLKVEPTQIERQRLTWNQAPPIPTPLATLIRRLGSESFRIREAASTQLRQIATAGGYQWVQENLLPEIIRAIGHSDPEISHRAIDIRDRIRKRIPLKIDSSFAPNRMRYALRVARVHEAPQAVHDLVAINKVLKQTADFVVNQDTHVKWGELRFDPKYTNLSNKRFRYSMRGELKKVPWKPQSKATLMARAKIWADTLTPLPFIRIEQSASVQSDSLALLRHFAKIAMKEKVEKPEPKGKYEFILKQLSKAESLNKVYSLLQEQKQLALETIDREIMEIQQEPPPEGENADSVQASRDHRVNEYRMMRRAVSKFHFTVKRQRAQITQIRIQGWEASGLFPDAREEVDIHELSLFISQEQVHATFKASLVVDYFELEELEEELTKLGKDIEKKDRKALNDVKSTYKDALEELRKVITGSKWD